MDYKLINDVYRTTLVNLIKRKESHKKEPFVWQNEAAQMQRTTAKNNGVKGEGNKTNIYLINEEINNIVN